MRQENIIIGTGWYTNPSRKHNTNSEAISKVYEPDWLMTTWKSYIESFIIPKQYIIYSCNIKELPVARPGDGIFFTNAQVVKAVDPPEEKDHRYDYHAAMQIGAMYALINDCDYLWIEQDCLVYGLDKIIDFARDYFICFGTGKICQVRNRWASQSLVWVRKDFISEFLARMAGDEIQQAPNHVPEVMFYNMFDDIVESWPFGYDRMPVTDWEQPMFYKQQMTEKEFKKFIDIMPKGKIV